MWNHLDLRARSLWTFAATKMSARRGLGRAMQRQRDAFYAHTWEQAAVQVGASLADLNEGLFAFRRQGQTTRVWKNYTPLDDPVTLLLAGNKPLVLGMLKDIAPVSPWQTFTIKSIDTAYQMLDGSPFVVKPARNTGAGSGVTTGVRTRHDLRRSVAIASAFDSTLLIEKQITGANYRLLFLQGELIEIVRRDPPAVVGDGRSSVRDLIGHENKLRREQGWQRAQTMLTIDDDLRRTLAAAGINLRTVPRHEENIVLKTVINENRAAENHPVDDVCGEIIATCGHCARGLGIQLAGVDIITPDPSVPLHASGGVVLEVNTTPGLYHHFDPEQMRCRIAPAILEAALRQSEASTRESVHPKWEVAS
ncbi:hypothetical protein AB1K70_23715 [Bremerella sp. JC770]|uniref:hypothetical protein n=1 Tax=Bremerella sp. JC770 TaxID=3232137 RepID=UPI003457D97E